MLQKQLTCLFDSLGGTLLSLVSALLVLGLPGMVDLETAVELLTAGIEQLQV